ncbi:hypothetical protein TWF225_001654 [Orbilia oligospora]|uniref:Uncharacterized protein n=1 Tax=Orbilia oligospora TaxID=2813651 RepID=A0A8H2E4L9_ORBOL|nr:hypothetical protein TWF225_001654 [Orbilia oligospora]KAF3233102.1 hypothetical protein TWF128_003264 [Orbilia oligospora]KAF3275825.1 hypothetical protein TWF132_002596 [Orbilia oligospora]TGJ72352.1 hypothetical protein EYR41_004251 [Orbilia oligospora]
MDDGLPKVYSLGDDIGGNLIDLQEGAGGGHWLESYGLQGFQEDYNPSEFGDPEPSNKRNATQNIAQNLLLTDVPAVLQTHEEGLGDASEAISVLKNKVEAHENIIRAFDETFKSSSRLNFDLGPKLEELSKDLKEFKNELAEMNRRMATIEMDLKITEQFCKETSPYLNKVREDITKIQKFLSPRPNREPKNVQQMRKATK